LLTDVHANLRGERRTLGDHFDDFFDPAVTAVVSIDMIRSHLDDPVDCPCPGGEHAQEAIVLTDAFHRGARALGVPIIHARSTLRRGAVDDPPDDPANWRRILRWEGAAGPLLAEHVVQGTRWVEFVTEVLPEDLIVEKRRLSAFTATDLDFLLRNLGTRIVVIDGIFIDACDLSTAFQASDLDYKVITLADVVRGSSVEMESAALSIFSSYIGLVLESQDLLAEWQARVDARPRS
jgi:nicotinamidase-related amidase